MWKIILNWPNLCRNSLERANRQERRQGEVGGGGKQTQAFVKIKLVLTSPALRLPDLTKSFHLYYANEKGYHAAEKHGDRMRPVTYYSTQQRPVVAELHRYTEAFHCIIKGSQPITLMETMVLYSPHSKMQLLETRKLRAELDSGCVKLTSR